METRISLPLQGTCFHDREFKELCSLLLTPWEPVWAGIRDHVVTAVELKFNCFFLMPLIDTFPTRLREELEAAYEEDLDEVRAL